MAYDQASRSYKMTDDGGNYDWILEGLDIRDYHDFTDEQIGEWVDALIEQSIEQEIVSMEADSEDLAFPRFGYTTAQEFEDLESYLEWKREEISSDLRAERDTMIDEIKDWIAREWVKARLGEPEDALMFDDPSILDGLSDDPGEGPSLDANEDA